ncbi:MAG: YfiT family bacillithiol transferase [Ekhidna sp.]
MDIEVLKYPLGKYDSPQEITSEILSEWIASLETLPDNLKKLVGNLSYDELEMQYRPGSWNIKQIVHHLADSHMNSFIRFKWILTEDKPTVKTYNEEEWAKTIDATNEEIKESTHILEGLHSRLIMLLKELRPDQLKRTFIHPEYGKEFTLEWMIGLYAWHSRHHLAHIKQAIALDGEFTPEKINE